MEGLGLSYLMIDEKNRNYCKIIGNFHNNKLFGVGLMRL